MDEKDDNIVNTFVARRAFQRKEAGEALHEEGTILDSADKISQVFGSLACSLGTEDLLVSIFLAERALFAVLVKAIGAECVTAVRKRAVERAVHDFNIDQDAVPERTVFTPERDDD